MKILVPMGGFGSRFKDAGYQLNKPSIPTFDRRSNVALPMVIAAMRDMPQISDPSTKLICVNRDFHSTDGTEDAIRQYFPDTVFVHDHVLLDQAFGCFLAREYLLDDDELFIGTCDNGCEIDNVKFENLKKSSDVIMFSHTRNENIARDPFAHSWARICDGSSLVKSLSIKKPVSDDYYNDHATTGMFWFKSSKKFLEMLSKLLHSRRHFNERLVLDDIINVSISNNLVTRFLDVKYLCWGTPIDYEAYQKTYEYWRDFFCET